MEKISERLTLTDLKEVRTLLYPARRKWYHIGIELGLSVEELDTIKAENTDAMESLTAMLKLWLKSIDPVPTRRALADALKARTINEIELAKEGCCLLYRRGFNKNIMSLLNLASSKFKCLAPARIME